MKRAHLLFPGQGQLLKELYTRDGAGVLISRDVYEGIRQAQASDVRAVQDLISPLVKEGILVGAPTLPNGLPYPDGDEIVDLLVPKDQVRSTMRAGPRCGVVWCGIGLRESRVRGLLASVHGGVCNTFRRATHVYLTRSVHPFFLVWCVRWRSSVRRRRRCPRR